MGVLEKRRHCIQTGRGKELTCLGVETELLLRTLIPYTLSDACTVMQFGTAMTERL